jgi:PAS domain S-box-containing protein
MDINTELTRLRKENESLKQHNIALHEAIERLRTLFDSLPVGIYRATPQGRILLYNSAMLELFGHDPSSPAGDIQDEVVTHRVGCTRADFRRQLEEAGELRGYESELYTDAGRPVRVRENARVVRDQHGTPLYYECTLEDVTEQRQIEEALRASEERYRSVVEYSPVGILLVDDQATVRYANTEAGKILGYPAQVLQDRHFTDWIHADDATFVLERYRLRQAGAQVPARYEIRVVRSDGAVRVVAISVTIYRDSHSAVRTIVQLLDITERQQAEHAMFQHTQELESHNAELDAFADSVAHDLRNPLSTIIGFAEALLEPYDDLSPEQLRTIIASMARVGRKMDSIIDELLFFARVRKTAVRPTPVNMAPLVDNVVHRLRQLIDSREAELVLPKRWPLALGYGPWIEEVWANYISNAVSYGGTPPRIELGADLLPDNRVRFWVRDNGDGVPPALRDRIFQGFGQTGVVRPTGHGLGLALVKRIIDKLDGEVGLICPVQDGRGSCFSFTLPVALMADDVAPIAGEGAGHAVSGDPPQQQIQTLTRDRT